MAGFILLHRQIMDNFAFHNPYCLKLWLYCLMKAAYKPQRVSVGSAVVELGPGQFVWGRAEAAAELNLGVKKGLQKSGSGWEYWLKELEKQEMIRRECHVRFSVITVVNYGRYQRSGFAKEDLVGSCAASSDASSDASSAGFTGEIPAATPESTEATTADSARELPLATPISTEATSIDSAGETLAATPELTEAISADSAGELPPATPESTEATSIDSAGEIPAATPESTEAASVDSAGEIPPTTPESTKTGPADFTLDNPPAKETICDPYTMYQKAFSRPLTEVIAQSIAEWTNDFDGNDELVAYAIEQAGQNAAHSPKYFESILRSWRKQGIRTLAEAKALVAEFEADKEEKLNQQLLRKEAEKKLARSSQQPLPQVSLHNWLQEDSGGN